MTLRQTLRAPPNRKQFYAVTQMTRALGHVAMRQGLSVPETLDAALLTLTSLVQGVVDVSEWDSVAQALADELRARLTVKGDTGPDDYWRKMV